MIDGPPDQDSPKLQYRLNRRKFLALAAWALASAGTVIAVSDHSHEKSSDNRSIALMHSLYGSDEENILNAIAGEDLETVFSNGFKNHIKRSENIILHEGDNSVDSVHITIEPKIRDGRDFVREYQYAIRRDTQEEVIGFFWQNKYSFERDGVVSFSGTITYDSGELDFDDKFVKNRDILTLLVGGTNELEQSILYSIAEQLYKKNLPPEIST